MTIWFGIKPEELDDKSLDKQNDGLKGNNEDIEPKLHPFIEGLLKTLPKPDIEWVLVERIKWLQAASKIFDLIYKPGKDEQENFISIVRKIHKLIMRQEK